MPPYDKNPLRKGRRAGALAFATTLLLCLWPAAAILGAGGEGIETLLGRALEMEKAGDWEEALRLYREAQFEDFGDLRPRLGMARSWLALDQLDRAAEALRPLLVDPSPGAEVLAIHGEILYRNERLEEARRAWEASLAAEETKAVRARLERLEREMRYSGEMRDALSTNFVLKYAGEQRSEGEADLLRVLEQEYAGLRRSLGGSPDAPIVVVLYPTDQFHEATMAPERAVGIYDGKVRLPFRNIDPGDRRFHDTLVHELTHAFIHYLGGDRVPRWLHEGLSEYMEGADPALHGKAHAREYLRTRDGGWGEAFSYPSALSFVSWLVERGGMGDVALLLERLRRGDGTDDALRFVYGRGYRELTDAWGRALVEAHL